MDSVRQDHCGIYEYERSTTPGLSDFELTIFNNAFANAPYTPASAPSYLESRLPLSDGHVALTETKHSLPDEFEDSSYTTAIAFNNVQLKRFGYAQRFDYIRDLTASASGDTEGGDGLGGRISDLSKNLITSILDDLPIRTNTEKRIRYSLKRQLLRRRGVNQPQPTDKEVIDAALTLIDDLPEPFILYIHLMDTHHPYEFSFEEFESVCGSTFEPELYARALLKAEQHMNEGSWLPEMKESERRCVKNAYDASIRHVDGLVSRFLDSLDSDTVTFITSDHGEELWDREYFGHAARPSKPRRMTLYEEMLRIPLVVHGVGSNRIDVPVSLLDLLPTMLNMSGVDIPDALQGKPIDGFFSGNDEEYDSRSIIAHATSPGDPEEYVSGENGHALGAVRDGRWKYIWDESHEDELFEIGVDVDEQESVADLNGDRVTEMRELIRRMMSIETDIDRSGRTTKDIEEELKALGYL